MKKAILTAILVGTITTANALDLTSCSATYTVAAAAFANVGENRNADGATYLALATRRAALIKQYNGNEQLATTMYKQSLQVQQGRIKNGGWPALSQDLKECQRVVDSNNIH